MKMTKLWNIIVYHNIQYFDIQYTKFWYPIFAIISIENSMNVASLPLVEKVKGEKKGTLKKEIFPSVVFLLGHHITVY